MHLTPHVGWWRYSSFLSEDTEGTLTQACHKLWWSAPHKVLWIFFHRTASGLLSFWRLVLSGSQTCNARCPVGEECRDDSCSRNLVSTHQPVCPIYIFLQVDGILYAILLYIVVVTMVLQRIAFRTHPLQLTRCWKYQQNVIPEGNLFDIAMV